MHLDGAQLRETLYRGQPELYGEPGPEPEPESEPNVSHPTQRETLLKESHAA